MLGNGETFAWLTPRAAVAREDGRGVYCWRQLDGSCRFGFNADGKDIVALARSPEHLLDICDVVLRLLAASVVHSIILYKKWSRRDDALLNAPSLAYLMEQCQSLKFLLLDDLVLDENHCRVLGAYYSRPGLEIELSHCRIAGTLAEALAEFLGRNQGSSKLDFCDIDNSRKPLSEELETAHFRQP
jgi:hypothetical protein